MASTPRVEPFCALTFLTAVLILHSAICDNRRIDIASAVLAGLCLGAAAGSKYQGLYAWVVVGAWLGWTWVTRRDLRTRQTVLSTAVIVLIAFAVTSPWWVKNLVAWQNPVYPMFNSRQLDRDSLTNANPYGGSGIQGITRIAADAINLVVTPSSCDGPPNHFPHYMFLLLPLVWFIPRRATIVTLIYLGLGYFSLSICLSHVLRHMFPCFSLLCIVVGYVIAIFETRFKLKVLLPSLLVCSLLFVVLLPARTTRMAVLGRYLMALDDESPFMDSIAPGFGSAISWLNENTPHDAVVLMCWDARQFRLKRRALIDPGSRTWELLARHWRRSGAEASAFLKSQGVQYVLVNEAALRYNVFKSRILPEDVLRDFQAERTRLVGSVLEVVFDQHGIAIYRVLEASADRASSDG